MFTPKDAQDIAKQFVDSLNRELRESEELDIELVKEK